MLQLEHISKQYVVGELVQKALDDVSLSLRDNEFVAILGPSGSGKTTLLNIVGGLDRYDSGDLIINGVSTKNYNDRDWDSYRNHSIGFVFQSYNLIPHQTVFSNVELALTISGIGKAERRERTKEALEKVGLADHMRKRPNQLSGGQAQRVAIARALINNPDVLLADEPTGALDTETSLQVMDLLKEVAKNRLVVMVTHNPELAEKYATRIVRLRDGQIVGDTDPYVPLSDAAPTIDEEKSDGENVKSADAGAETEAQKGRSADSENSTLPDKVEAKKKRDHTSMSFATSLSLSFNNLRTKKGRTILTAFAGSIGIIGIALILSLSTGVNDYITQIQKTTMTSYPITISAKTYDVASLMTSGHEQAVDKAQGDAATSHDLDAVYSNDTAVNDTASAIVENNLKAFKEYLDDPNSPINQYVGDNGIVYSYDTSFNVLTYDPDNVLINTDGSSLTGSSTSGMIVSSFSDMTGASMFSGGTTSGICEQLPAGKDGSLVSPMVTDNYDIVYGAWPTAANEVVIVLDENNELLTETIYQLGLASSTDYRKLMNQIDNGEDVSASTQSFSYQDICDKTYYLLTASDYYTQDDDGLFSSVANETSKVNQLINNNAMQLKVVGLIRPKTDADNATLTGTIEYTQALTDYIIDHTDASSVVQAQQADETKSVLTGMEFSPEDDAAKAADAKAYLSGLDTAEKANLCRSFMSSTGSGMSAISDTASDTAGSEGSSASSVSNSASDAIGSRGSEASAVLSTTSAAAGLQNSQSASISGSASSGASSVSNTAGSNTTLSNMGAGGLLGLIGGMGGTSTQISSLDDETLASMFDAYLANNPDENMLLTIYDTYVSTGSYDDNMSTFGYVDRSLPSTINIYVDSFEDKDAISACIDEFNASADESDQIVYTDYVGLLLSSVTTIVNAISYVLIAFVAVSLVVSSIMIGIITYISVLERTKEIGILRALGASKRNVSEVFDAETFIIGLGSGIIGIAMTLLLLIPMNIIIHVLAETDAVSAFLPVSSALILIALSVLLTLIAGFIPSKKAARKDPVTALRTE